ncbi:MULTISPECIES: hypothetical protein [unclassified Mesorhizobium]|uniref:hypothetical protein n=1 Tax=unclassified Mesorhizobium TaxID=325217 RepID=UPI00301439BA
MSKSAFDKIEAGLNDALDYARNSSLKPSNFHIGMEFEVNGGTFRCTDVGTRTVVAIRIDPVEITTKHSDGTVTNAVLSRAEAENAGWFNGPPYALAELVFDEDDLQAHFRINSGKP